MSWIGKIFSAPFPATSNIWWSVVSGLLFTAMVLAIIGESLWLFGVRNFDAYTWFVRYTIPRPWLIGFAIGFGLFGIFIAIHFSIGRGWITGPNTR
jgi:hypothetical protein